ncbi:MAG: FYDLN acid domain-containing protein [Hyphomicrobium sp.]|nr:FYDLN acid domain-containing protein [Hyphomicrobium sp.]
MSKQLNRGTKRICQSAVCALPFYDLNRTDICCPNCGARAKGSRADATTRSQNRRARRRWFPSA